MSTGDSAANTLRERTGESRLKLWLLLELHRLLATAILAVFVFVTFVVLVAVIRPPLIPQLQSGDAIETMFSTMITAVVTVTTLTVTIGQVVLTQENGPLGEQHGRMSDAMNVRSFVGELIGEPSPADPSAFLSEIVEACEERARDLRNAVSGGRDDQLVSDVDDLVDSIIDNGEVVRAELETSSFGSYNVLSAALNFNYGSKIYQLEQIQANYEESLDESQRTRLDDLRSALSMYAPAREHVKTLYFQWELINLSQQILYLAVPALVVAGVMVAVVEPASFTGSILAVDNILWVIAGAFTFTLLPFLLLVSYILRIVTITKHTLAIEPLVLRDSDQ